MSTPKIDVDACVGCGACVDTCPEEVFAMNDDESKAVVVNADACVQCEACIEACPEEAITLE